MNRRTLRRIADDSALRSIVEYQRTELIRLEQSVDLYVGERKQVDRVRAGFRGKLAEVEANRQSERRDYEQRLQKMKEYIESLRLQLEESQQKLVATKIELAKEIVRNPNNAKS